MEIMYSILRDCCNGISEEGENKEKRDKVIEAYYRILEFVNVARKDGLLYLEEKTRSLDDNDLTQSFFKNQMFLVVDCTEPEFVVDVGINELISKAAKSYDGLIELMYLRGSLMIQDGENPRIIEVQLKSMLPRFIKKELEDRENKGEMSEKEDENIIEKLCNDKEEIDRKDHSLINQTAITFMDMSDDTMQRLLRDINDKQALAVVLKAIPGKARKRVFDNVSSGAGTIISEYMEEIGDISIHYAEEKCAVIMKKLIKLTDCYELFFDVTAIRIVLDLYEGQKNKN